MHPGLAEHDDVSPFNDAGGTTGTTPKASGKVTPAELNLLEVSCAHEPGIRRGVAKHPGSKAAVDAVRVR